jgi:hypothetical protein
MTGMTRGDVLQLVQLAESGVGQGKVPGDLTPGFFILWLVFAAGVVFFWVQHIRRNRKK